MNDIDIRKPLLASLMQDHSNEPSTRIVEEFGLCEGEARVDVAVVNGAIHGYEIKSERDSLYRLDRQQNIYNRVLDTVTLVASRKHLENAKTKVPSWWGLSVARCTEDRIEIQAIRAPEKNNSIDPTAIVQLLWRDEALEILKAKSLQKGITKKPRDIIWERLVENLSLDELRLVVREKIKSRQNWRSDQL